MRTQGSSALACRHAVLSLLVPGLVLHCTSPPRPMRVQSLELHGPSCTLVCGSFPPHSPAPCLSVGPRAGSLTSSPWPSPDGPRGETPRTTGFQTPGVISVRSPAILSCLTTLPLPTEAPAAFSAPVLRLGGPHSYASADVLGTSVLQNPNAAHVGTLPFLVVKQKPDIKGVGALKNPKFSSLSLTHLYHNLCWKP